MGMTEDIFAEQNYGKVALRTMAPTDPRFQLYMVGWLGAGTVREVMQVSGAVFRYAMRGPNKASCRSWFLGPSARSWSPLPKWPPSMLRYSKSKSMIGARPPVQGSKMEISVEVTQQHLKRWA